MILKANIKMFVKWNTDQEGSDFEQIFTCFPLLHLGLFTENLEPLPDKGWRDLIVPLGGPQEKGGRRAVFCRTW